MRVIAVNNLLTPTFIGRLIPPVAKIIEESNQADREWLKTILENSSQRLGQSELKFLTEIREGDPKRVLGEAAKEWGADSFFVGSIGFGSSFERFVLGSVSASVAARAHCSVEIVRPRERNGDHNDERQSPRN